MNFELWMEADSAACDMSDCIKTLRILRDAVTRELISIEKTNLFPGSGYLMEVCEAMAPALRDLERIQDNLSAAVTAECERKKGK